FQAEDGIRDKLVTGVQTCALPIFRQRWLLLSLRLDRLLLRPACRRGLDGKPFGGNRLGDDLAVPHLVDVRVHQAGDQGLAEAEEIGRASWGKSVELGGRGIRQKKR